MMLKLSIYLHTFVQFLFLVILNWRFLPYVTALLIAGYVPSGLEKFHVIIVKSQLCFSWN